MTQLVTVQEFIALAREVSTPEMLRALMADITDDMGFDHFALLHHIDLAGYRRSLDHMRAGEMVALSTYPESWIETYVARDIVSNDPVLLASHRTNVGFFWDEIPQWIDVTQAHRDIRADTERAGIGAGFTVPAHVPGEANGSCNFAMAVGRDAPARNREMAQLVGSFAFSAARVMVENAGGYRQKRKGRLSQRQIECVVLAARGKSSWEIGRVLGIAPGTVRRHLELAREHYNVTTREQVIMRALFDGLFSLTDALRR